MAHHGIGEALVYHATCRSSGPQPGNGILLEELADHSELHPCWTLLPHWTGEIGEPEEAVGGMLARGVNAAKIYPTYHSFALAEWSVGPLLAALQQHRVPLLMDFDIIHWGHDAVPWDSIYQLCRSHPDLPIILLRLSIMDNRNFFPLLATPTSTSVFRATDGGTCPARARRRWSR